MNKNFCCDCLCFDFDKELKLSRSIDEELRRTQLVQEGSFKILLLGCGDAGKSTLLKQFKSLNGENLSESELENYRLIVFSNVIRGIQVLFDAALKLNYPFSNTSNIRAGLGLSGMPSVSEDINDDTFHYNLDILKGLWCDEALKMAFDNRNKFLIADNVKYFLDHIDRISKPNYLPTQEDVLRCRKPTKCITEYDCTINKIKFKFIDVGGQRSQRNRWLRCFENVTTMIFVVPCNDFDMVIIEDRNTNVIDESKQIFKSIVNHPDFSQSVIIVDFNKTDLLMKKIAVLDIKEYQNDFEGDSKNLIDVQQYFIKTFRELMPQNMSGYFFFTTALEEDSAKLIYDAVKMIVISGNLKSLMI